MSLAELRPGARHERERGEAARGRCRHTVVTGRRALVGVMLAPLVITDGAWAAPPFVPCVSDPEWECAQVAVPKYPRSSARDRVFLHVERLAAGTADRPPVLALAGGPGQGASPFRDTFATLVDPGATGRDLVLVDLRGTGGSGALRCQALQRARLSHAGPAAAACARKLGRDRALYTTATAARDLEAVRAALGIERWALFGISYGAKVAVAYAVRHSRRVERIALDSPLAPTGPDPLLRDTASATVRALRVTCVRRCRHVTRDAGADLIELRQRLRRAAARGAFVGASGQRRKGILTAAALVRVLIGGDVDPALREPLPGAIRAVLEGDATPLLRLAAAADAERPARNVREFSAALNAATLCGEVSFPWGRLPRGRHRLRRAAREIARELGPAGGAFGIDAVLGSDLIELCRRWPVPVGSARVPSRSPSAPTLVLAGDEDVRTPLRSARRIALRLPNARLVVVPGAGHNAIATDPGDCAAPALARFLDGLRPARRCRRAPARGLLPPAPPRALAAVPRFPGLPTRVGRTVNAVSLALDDLVLWTAARDRRGLPRLRSWGGLRAGRFERRRRRLLVRGYSYVPGVALTGSLDEDFAGAIRVTGRAAARGRLRLYRDGLLRGRLGGRAVVARFVAEQ